MSSESDLPTYDRTVKLGSTVVYTRWVKLDGRWINCGSWVRR